MKVISYTDFCVETLSADEPQWVEAADGRDVAYLICIAFDGEGSDVEAVPLGDVLYDNDAMGDERRWIAAIPSGDFDHLRFPSREAAMLVVAGETARIRACVAMGIDPYE